LEGEVTVVAGVATSQDAADAAWRNAAWFAAGTLGHGDEAGVIVDHRLGVGVLHGTRVRLLLRHHGADSKQRLENCGGLFWFIYILVTFLLELLRR